MTERLHPKSMPEHHKCNVFSNKDVRLIIKNSLLSVNLGENFHIDICQIKDI